jgi:hypothetical protein
VTGRKTLAEIRGELEAVMDRIPSEAGPVTQALREFLAHKPTAAGSALPPRGKPAHKTKKAAPGTSSSGTRK